jgi:hypothetical protein
VQKKHLERWCGVAGAGLNENKMPLVRYEVRSEHRLAKPELYRAAAARDDSQALLEGVAVAGLLGIVRQLGDLAEYVNAHFFLLPKLPFSSSSADWLDLLLLLLCTNPVKICWLSHALPSCSSMPH